MYFFIFLMNKKFEYFEVALSLLICAITSLFTENKGIIILLIYICPFVVSFVFKSVENKANEKRNINETIKLAKKQKNKIAVVQELNNEQYVFLSNCFWKIENNNIFENDIVKVVSSKDDKLIVESVWT